MTTSRISGFVGHEVDYRPAGAGDDRAHGVITTATYNLAGEAVVVIHPDPRATGPGADTVLLGPAATAVLRQLEEPDLATPLPSREQCELPSPASDADRLRRSTRLEHRHRAATTRGVGPTAPAAGDR